MTRPVKLRIVTKTLHQNGWFQVRQVGSHQTWAHCTCGAYEDGDCDEAFVPDTSARGPETPAKSNAEKMTGSVRVAPRARRLVIDTNVHASPGPRSARKRLGDQLNSPAPSLKGKVTQREKRRHQIQREECDGDCNVPATPVKLVAPFIPNCTCLATAVGSQTFASISPDSQRRLKRNGDRITIVGQDQVDPKCIMMLKRVLLNVPPEW